MPVTRYTLNGREVSREEWLEGAAGVTRGSPPATNMHPSGWPMASDGLGVHPKQRAEAVAEAKRLGVPTDYDEAGRAVLTDPGHRKKLMKVLGMEDRGKKVVTAPKGRRPNERV